MFLQEIDEPGHARGDTLAGGDKRDHVRPVEILRRQDALQSATADGGRDIPLRPQRDAEPGQRPIAHDLSVVAGEGRADGHRIRPTACRRRPYDPLADFEPIGLAGTAPTMLVARPSLPASNLPDFVAYAVANRAKATYGSAGVGSISHFACGILLSALKQNITHVPYRGVAPAINDLMGGHIDVVCDQSTTALPQVTGGKIKALAVLTDQRLAQLPDVATAASFGYGDVNIRSWNALFAPNGTAASVIKRLNVIGHQAEKGWTIVDAGWP
ncbi:MAG: tripartite tricarboxylate transporter substrate-binding protein [Xanthobacteraceae bacterium]